ncbi:hypothetical protein [Streptomyces sp. MMS24-I29]|uniref:hypothetical protein n=1 Tax=Streptomyces sp. MMS24-I29 TaxID=3351480 RepID=UPI003C7A6CF4
MFRDDERLLTTEMDAMYGLDPAGGDPPVLVKDPAVRAVWAWSPRARLLAVGAGVGARARQAALADHRGRRLAPAVVAAWATRERRNKEVLFYSTSSDNHASRSVARRLGLTPSGWIWTVR